MATKPTDGLNEPLEFVPDASSRRKKGAHKPEYASVFLEAGEIRDGCARVHLLVNPFAGKKNGRKIAARVIQLVEDAGVEISCSYSSYSGHLVTMASALVVEAGDVVAVVGGDGSLSEVITGRMLLGKATKETFAIVPAGTGNSQAHDLRIDSVETAVNAMLSGRTQALDLARVELTEGLPVWPGGNPSGICNNWVTGGLGVDPPSRGGKRGGGSY